MGFWSRLGGAIGLSADANTTLTDGTRETWEGRFWGGFAPGAIAGLVVGWRSALQLDVVQAVLGRLGGTCSTLPIMVYQRVGDEGDAIPVRSHPVFKLLSRRPNLTQTAQEFRSEQVQHLAYWRNAYTRLIPDPETGHPIGSLEQIHPSRLEDLWRGPDGWTYYRFTELAPRTGSFVIRQDELWHIRMAPLTEDGLRGQYMWESSRETFGRAIAVENFGSLFFANGGSGGGVLEHPGVFTNKDEQTRFLETWREGGSGLNRHKDRLLLNNVKYTPFSVRNDEAQFLETKKEMGGACARLFGMPPHMVGMLDKATNNNIEQQSLEYVMYCVAPILSAVEESAARDLLIGDEQDEFYVEHNVNGLLRGDWKSRWAGYGLGRQWGWLSVNDVLRLEGMAPIGPEGDERLVPMNMSAAGQPGADGSAGPTPRDKAPGDAEQDPDGEKDEDKDAS